MKSRGLRAAAAATAAAAAAVAVLAATLVTAAEMKDLMPSVDPLVADVAVGGVAGALFAEDKLEERCKMSIGKDNLKKWTKKASQAVKQLLGQNKFCDALTTQSCGDWYSGSAYDLERTACQKMYLAALTIKWKDVCGENLLSPMLAPCTDRKEELAFPPYAIVRELGGWGEMKAIYSGKNSAKRSLREAWLSAVGVEDQLEARALKLVWAVFAKTGLTPSDHVDGDGLPDSEPSGFSMGPDEQLLASSMMDMSPLVDGSSGVEVASGRRLSRILEQLKEGDWEEAQMGVSGRGSVVSEHSSSSSSSSVSGSEDGDEHLAPNPERDVSQKYDKALDSIMYAIVGGYRQFVADSILAKSMGLLEARVREEAGSKLAEVLTTMSAGASDSDDIFDASAAGSTDVQSDIDTNLKGPDTSMLTSVFNSIYESNRGGVVSLLENDLNVYVSDFMTRWARQHGKPEYMKNTFDTYLSLRVGGSPVFTKILMTELVTVMSMAYEYGGPRLWSDGNEVLEKALPPRFLKLILTPAGSASSATDAFQDAIEELKGEMLVMAQKTHLLRNYLIFRAILNRRTAGTIPERIAALLTGDLDITRVTNARGMAEFVRKLRDSHDPGLESLVISTATQVATKLRKVVSDMGEHRAAVARKAGAEVTEDMAAAAMKGWVLKNLINTMQVEAFTGGCTVLRIVLGEQIGSAEVPQHPLCNLITLVEMNINMAKERTHELHSASVRAFMPDAAAVPQSFIADAKYRARAGRLAVTADMADYVAPTDAPLAPYVVRVDKGFGGIAPEGGPRVALADLYKGKTLPRSVDEASAIFRAPTDEEDTTKWPAATAAAKEAAAGCIESLQHGPSGRGRCETAVNALTPKGRFAFAAFAMPELVKDEFFSPLISNGVEAESVLKSKPSLHPWLSRGNLWAAARPSERYAGAGLVYGHQGCTSVFWGGLPEENGRFDETALDALCSLFASRDPLGMTLSLQDTISPFAMVELSKGMKTKVADLLAAPEGGWKWTGNDPRLAWVRTAMIPTKTPDPALVCGPSAKGPARESFIQDVRRIPERLSFLYAAVAKVCVGSVMGPFLGNAPTWGRMEAASTLGIQTLSGLLLSRSLAAGACWEGDATRPTLAAACLPLEFVSSTLERLGDVEKVTATATQEPVNGELLSEAQIKWAVGDATFKDARSGETVTNAGAGRPLWIYDDAYPKTLAMEKRPAVVTVLPYHVALSVGALDKTVTLPSDKTCPTTLRSGSGFLFRRMQSEARADASADASADAGADAGAVSGVDANAVLSSVGRTTDLLTRELGELDTMLSAGQQQQQQQQQQQVTAEGDSSLRMAQTQSSLRGRKAQQQQQQMQVQVQSSPVDGALEQVESVTKDASAQLSGLEHSV